MKLRLLGALAFAVLLSAPESVIAAATQDTPASTGQPTPGTSVGKAIANGVKGFVNVLFPASNLLSTVGNWLSSKLSEKQAADVKKGHSTDLAPKVTQALADLKAASDALKLSSAALEKTTLASVKIAGMLAVIDSTPQGIPLPLPRLRAEWNDAKDQLTKLRSDKVLSDAATTVTDMAVLDCIRSLDLVVGGPIVTIDDNIKDDKGDRRILKERLTDIAGATGAFNSMAIIVLGSTGRELTTVINNVKGAGGGSLLDQQTSEVIGRAKENLTTQLAPLQKYKKT